jgi:hypothetical protein
MNIRPSGAQVTAVGEVRPEAIVVSAKPAGYTEAAAGAAPATDTSTPAINAKSAVSIRRVRNPKWSASDAAHLPGPS